MAKEKAKAKTEARKLRMHPAMLFDIIKRQAGTIGKAVMEGVMNGVDAGAPQIRIGLTQDQLTLLDNGMGMTDRKHIETFWETFGQPPTEEEKKRKTYGQFRMGRGQLFAFGLNTWRTGTFRMQVDIQRKGDDWTLEDDLPAQEGCLIDVQLYEKILPSEIAAISRDLEVALKYVPAEVIYNEKRVSRDATKEKWQHETPEAFIRFTDSGGLRIYNLGILVGTLDARRYGIGGEIVSRKQLKVNFARNEVMADCPVWKEILKLVDKRAKEKIKKQPQLTDASRQNLIDEFIAEGQLDPEWEDAKLLGDVTGRFWALNNVVATRYSKIITVAPVGNLRGDKLMQHKLAFVVSERTLEEFHVGTVPELLTLLETVSPNWGWFTYKPLSELDKTLNEKFDIIPETDWTVREQVVMQVLRRALHGLLHYVYDKNDADKEVTKKHRALRLGVSNCANGWTNGLGQDDGGYIAIDRQFIKDTEISISGWVSYGCLMIHELCHDSSDQETHVHGEEFYQAYHDWTRHSLRTFVEQCMKNFPGTASRLEAKLGRRQLADADMVVKTSRAEELLSAKLDLKPDAKSAKKKK